MIIPKCFQKYYDEANDILECPLCHQKIQIVYNVQVYDFCCGFLFKVGMISGIFYYFSIPFSNNGSYYKLIQSYINKVVVIYLYDDVGGGWMADKKIIHENIIVDWDFENISQQLETYLLFS